jgi:hypothetical protein
LVYAAYERCKPETSGRNSQVYPALARVPSHLVGICVVGTTGQVYAVGMLSGIANATLYDRHAAQSGHRRPEDQESPLGQPAS